MQKITSLDDLRPKRSQFTILSNGKSYEVRELDIATEEIIQKKYGAPVLKLFEQYNQEAVFDILYMLIVDKSDFKAHEVTEIDLQGNEVTRKIGGVEKMKYMLTGGAKEQLDIASALMEAITGRSTAEIKAAVSEQEAEAAKKKKTQTKSTGSSK